MLLQVFVSQVYGMDNLVKNPFVSPRNI